MLDTEDGSAEVGVDRRVAVGETSKDAAVVDEGIGECYQDDKGEKKGFWKRIYARGSKFMPPMKLKKELKAEKVDDADLREDCQDNQETEVQVSYKMALYVGCTTYLSECTLVGFL